MRLDQAKLSVDGYIALRKDMCEDSQIFNSVLIF
jgi:hypothetical protein